MPLLRNAQPDSVIRTAAGPISCDTARTTCPACTTKSPFPPSSAYSPQLPHSPSGLTIAAVPPILHHAASRS